MLRCPCQCCKNKCATLTYGRRCESTHAPLNKASATQWKGSAAQSVQSCQLVQRLALNPCCFNRTGARGGSRTHMRKNPRRILSPQRLPFRHPGIGSSSLIVQAYGHPPLCFLNPFLAPLCMFCVFRRPAASATSLPDGEW